MTCRHNDRPGNALSVADLPYELLIGHSQYPVGTGDRPRSAQFYAVGLDFFDTVLFMRQQRPKRVDKNK